MTTTEQLDVALETSRRFGAAVVRMADSGWRLTKFATSLRLSGSGSPTDLLADLREVAAVSTNARAVGDFGTASLTLQVDRGGRALVADTSNNDLGLAFPPETVDAARDAWAGDLQAAVGLEGHWTAEVDVDLATPLRAVDPGRAWYVLMSDDDVLTLIESLPFWELRQLLSESSQLVILLVSAEPDLLVRTNGALIQSLGGALNLSAVDDQQPHRVFSGVLVDLPRPDLLAPIEVRGDGAAPLAEKLWRMAAGVAWAWLATDAALDDAGRVTLEYFGLQRVSHTVERAGPQLTEPQARAAVELWRWAATGSATDQILATRQVLSLYRDRSPWDRAEDVKRAAESVFLALRGDAVAEAFKAQRDARTLALAVARQTGEATATLAKGAVERCLASLLAVGGVIVAKSTSTLTSGEADRLHVLLGVTLFLLALWSIFVEGPPVTAASAGLRMDLDSFSDLLSVGDRDAIASMASFRAAKADAYRARWLVPIAYAVSGVAALAIH